MTDITITKPPNIWGSTEADGTKQKWRESFNSIVEVKAKAQGNELQLKPQFRGLEELLFRAELETLMSEAKRDNAVFAVNADFVYGDKARWVGEFVKQDRDYIVGELQKRLASLGMYPDGEQLKLYLNCVSKVIKAKLARGETVSAIPFTDKNYSGKRGKGKKNKKPKAGKKRPVMVNGEIFESISAADKATGLGYHYIQKSTLRKYKEAQENSL